MGKAVRGISSRARKFANAVCTVTTAGTPFSPSTLTPMADCEVPHVIQATGPFRIAAEGMHFRARENGLHNPPICTRHDNQAGRSQYEGSLRLNHCSMRPAVAGILGSRNRPPS